jgi:hypothetical protein
VVEYLPAPHTSHEAEATFETEPEAQVEQPVFPVPEANSPASQFVQPVEEEDDEKVPAAQSVHTPPRVEYFPATHGEQDVADDPEEVPARQLLQIEDPAEAAYLPSVQSLHTMLGAPSSDVLPAGQLVHAAKPELDV